MANVVVRSSIRPDPALVAQLQGSGVATVHEVMGRRGLLASSLRPAYPGTRIAGRAVTVLSQAGDNLMIQAAVELCDPGDILAVALVSGHALSLGSTPTNKRKGRSSPCQA